jgi:hypothetical protein
MARLWKSETDFHSRLEISQRTRDSHIYTSRLFLFTIKETKRRTNHEKLETVTYLSTESDQAQFVPDVVCLVLGLMRRRIHDGSRDGHAINPHQ